MGTVILGILGFAVFYGLLVWALYFARKKHKRSAGGRQTGNLDECGCDWSPVYGDCACGARIYYSDRSQGSGGKSS